MFSTTTINLSLSLWKISFYNKKKTFSMERHSHHFAESFRLNLCVWAKERNYRNIWIFLYLYCIFSTSTSPQCISSTHCRCWQTHWSCFLACPTHQLSEDGSTAQFLNYSEINFHLSQPCNHLTWWWTYEKSQFQKLSSKSQFGAQIKIDHHLPF